MSERTGESHRARAQRVVETKQDDGYGLVHALLAIEERLDVIAQAVAKPRSIDARRRDADDPTYLAKEHW